MADLLAHGPEPQQQWREPLPEQPVTLGRRKPYSTWAASWDEHISKLHATLAWRDGKLFVRREPQGRNPIFFQGEDQQFDEFAVNVGESFVIGATTFSVAEGLPPDGLDMTPDAELSCSREE